MGYAAYVWSAYAVSAAVLVATVAMTYVKWHCAKKRLERLTVSSKG